MTVVERGAAGGGYRPFLDGLRVVAVYLVVLFHGGADRFSGGFVGVDVFFVLSGFLVTRLLLRDLVGSGSIGFGRFYARRFRRLLPAAFVVLVVSAVVFSALASPVEVVGAEGGFRAAFLYVTNWYFISQSTQYFGADLATNPVLQFWSLAVEEQFYLLWPLLLGGLFVVSGRFGPRRWKVLRGLVLVGAVVSLWWAWSLRSSDPVRAYYGTDARAYQLMAGALVALTPGLFSRLARFARPARWVGVLGLVGLGVVASWLVGWDPIERGVAATVVTVVVIVALEVADGGLARWVLSTGPMVYLGKISYGTYLWHWPVIWVMARTLDLSTVSTIALTVVVATALASLSFQLLEHPIRVSGLLDRYRKPVIAVGLAVSVLSAVVIIPGIVDRADPVASAAPGATDLATTGFTPVPQDLDFRALAGDFTRLTSCYDKPAEACTLVEGTGAHILLMGDSHAGMMTPTFDAIAKEQDLTLSVSARGGCPWQRELYAPEIALANSTITHANCRQRRDDLYERVIPALDPDIIVVMNFPYETPGQPIQYEGDDVRPAPGSPEYDALVEDATVRSLDELRAGGRNVVLLEPIAYNTEGLNPLACLSQATVVEDCRYVADTTSTNLELLYRRLDDDDDHVWSADLDRLVCPFLPICDPIIDGLLVKVDASHLHRDFARSLAPAVTAYLEDNGVIPG